MICRKYLYLRYRISNSSDYPHRRPFDRKEMVASTAPLLRARPDDDESDTDSVSSSSGEHKHWFCRPMSYRNIVPFVLTLIITITFVLTVTLFTRMDMPKRKNVVLMVSDGMGPASLSFARSFMQYTQGADFSTQLPLDPFIVGTSRTRSHSLHPINN